MSKATRAQKEEGEAGRVLFISYFFPPTAGGGVFRPLATVKYLSRLGWDITVITSTTPKHYPVDPELARQIPADVAVIRIPVVWEGSTVRRALGRLNLDWIPKSLITPDERIFWAEKAERKSLKLLKQGGFDCLYTTGPPFSVLLAGLWLKRETGAKWLAEFRDPWTLAPYLSTQNALHRRFARDVESELMEKADATIMVTQSFAEMMRKKYPESKARVHCVENGFDPEDFAGLPKEKARNEEFTIVASGTIFGRYNMNDFLDGLMELKKSDPAIYGKIKVSLQGLPDPTTNRRLLDSGLFERVKSRGFVPHREDIRDMCSADLLILPLSKVPNGEGHVPSRAYEFLATGSPILAICPDGDLANIISGFSHIKRVYPGDKNGIVEALRDFVSKWESGAEVRGPEILALSAFSRIVRAKEIDSIISNLRAKRGSVMRILYIAPGNNPHTWKWVGWFGKKYPGEIGLIPYEAPVPDGKLPGVEIFKPHLSIFEIRSIKSWMEVGRVRSIVLRFKPDLLHVLWAYGSGTYGAKEPDFIHFCWSPWGQISRFIRCDAGSRGLSRECL